jgi:hypothetical protein
MRYHNEVRRHSLQKNDPPGQFLKYWLAAVDVVFTVLENYAKTRELGAGFGAHRRT